MIRDDDFKLLRGFAERQTDEPTNEQTDICDCRVAFATEKLSTTSWECSTCDNWIVTENKYSGWIK